MFEHPITFRLKPKDLEECRRARDSFIRNRQLLVRHMADYPIECCFSSFYFLLEKEHEIDRVIAWLESEFARLDAPPPAPPQPPASQSGWRIVRWIRSCWAFFTAWWDARGASASTQTVAENSEDSLQKYIQPGGILAQHVAQCREMLQAFREEKHRRLMMDFVRRGYPVYFIIPNWRSFKCLSMENYQDMIRWFERALERWRPRPAAS